MEMEYVGEILEDGRLAVSPDIRRRFSVGEKVRVRFIREKSTKAKGLSPQAEELIRLFEQSPDRGGYNGHEITREYIHEREDIF
ncbi:MAG: hypothetical protein JRH18_11740 [Deltaproteobacteria bacterium]|nr:hypothetical protein [Deltaproteobacteria bacterium]MBW2152330.1 hypothetical protein [Deltaproteobacteria bacterium]